MKNLTKYAVIGLALLPVLAFAQAGVGGSGVTTSINTLSGLWGKINEVVNWIMIIFFLVATVFIIMAGFKYLTAGGDPAEIESAKHMLTYAVVGIVVGLLAFSIPAILRQFLNVNVSAPSGGSVY